MKVSEKQHVQRTWGSTRPGMLGKQQGGSCAWSRVRHGRQRGQAVQSCVGHGEDLGFLPQWGWEPWRAAGRDRT